MARTNIIVSFAIEGTHCWPECDVKGVEFLRHPHRHIFYFVCKKSVKDNNREIEIISFKRQLMDYLSFRYGVPCEFKNKSCEMIAGGLVQQFNLDYCSVLEDNENGAEVIVERML